MLCCILQKAGKPADKKKDQAGVGFLLLLDVEMDAPVITMPRSSDSQDFLEVDLGELKMTNRINWLFGTSPKDKKVINPIPVANDPGDRILSSKLQWD